MQSGNANVNVLETEWWSIGVPPEWWAEREEDSIVIGDRDDVGSIEISTLWNALAEASGVDVERIARESGEPAWQWSACTAGAFSGIGCSYVEGQDAVWEWYLAHGPLLLFVTYSCDIDNSGLDLAAVEEILETLAAVE